MANSRRRVSGWQDSGDRRSTVSDGSSRWRPTASIRCISVQLASQAAWGVPVVRM